MADFDATLIDIIEEHATTCKERPTRETPIADLGVDSFAVVEIIYEVEEKLGLEIPFNANENPFGDMETVGELIDAVKRLSKPVGDTA